MNYHNASAERRRAFRVALGAEIRERRGVMVISQALLARASRITQASVSNYEHGKRELPLHTALAMATFLYPDGDALVGLATLIRAAERRLETGHPGDRATHLPASAQHASAADSGADRSAA